VFEIVQHGFLDQHLRHCQAVYRGHAAAMTQALERHMRELATWDKPQGGMFQWLEFAHHVDAGALLEDALAAGVAYVPGAPFFASGARNNTARLCFSTSSPQDIEKGIALLAGVVRAARDGR
jgi:2-aminoadipate transaminase